MKHLAFVLTAGLAAAALAATAAGPAIPGTVTVKRDGARLMKAPRFFGPACPGLVRAKDRLRIAKLEKGWGLVDRPGDKCWLHQSAWLDKTSGELVGDPSKASQRDIELAGRGFSEGAEREYRAAHADLAKAFQTVDEAVEKGGEPDPEDLERFAAEGGLPTGGAAGGAP